MVEHLVANENVARSNRVTRLDKFGLITRGFLKKRAKTQNQNLSFVLKKNFFLTQNLSDGAF